MLEEMKEKWNDIRLFLHTVWDDLTTSDREKLEAFSFEETVDYLKEKYNETEDEVINKFRHILEDIDDPEEEGF